MFKCLMSSSTVELHFSTAKEGCVDGSDCTDIIETQCESLFSLTLGEKKAETSKRDSAQSSN